MKTKCMFNIFYKAYDSHLFFSDQAREFINTIEDFELKKYLILEVTKELINNDRIKSAKFLMDIIEDDNIKEEALKYFNLIESK